MNEVLDPVHGFIVFSDLEKSLIDSAPVQRLRDIHQLALEFMVYPGATHKRFEHSLGVMHLAGLVFDSLFPEDHLAENITKRLKDILKGNEGKNKKYWRKVVRLAGLLHDIGHPMFSHTAEGLLPDGTTHEHMTGALLKSDFLSGRMNEDHGDLVQDVYDCCIDVTKRKDKDEELAPWKALLNEIITSDVFGADRMDYLLRDSMYTGVAYGHFDKDRLISCLRVGLNDVDEPSIGVKRGGLHAAESLLIARFFMYEQVYFHKVRNIYDIHLGDFLKASIGGRLSIDPAEYLVYSDSRYLDEMRIASLDSNHSLHELARRVFGREHFRVCYSLSKPDRENNPNIITDLKSALEGELGKDNIKSFQEGPKDRELDSKSPDFPLIGENGSSTLASGESQLIRTLPQSDVGYIYCPDCIRDSARDIIKHVRAGSSTPQQRREGEGNGT